MLALDLTDGYHIANWRKGGWGNGGYGEVFADGTVLGAVEYGTTDGGTGGFGLMIGKSTGNGYGDEFLSGVPDPEAYLCG